jgi:hypothetical protein
VKGGSDACWLGFASLFLTLFPFLLYLLSPLVLFFFLFFFICFVLFSLSLVVQMSLSVGPARHHIGVAWHGTDGRETKKKALLTSVRPNQLRRWVAFARHHLSLDAAQLACPLTIPSGGEQLFA